MTTSEQEKRLINLKNTGIENSQFITIEFRKLWNEIEDLKRRVTKLEGAK